MKDETAEVQTILTQKSCGFLSRKVTLENGRRVFRRWYFPFSELLDSPADLQVGTVVRFSYDEIETPTGRYPVGRNIEIVSQPTSAAPDDPLQKQAQLKSTPAFKTTLPVG